MRRDHDRVDETDGTLVLDAAAASSISSLRELIYLSPSMVMPRPGKVKARPGSVLIEATVGSPRPRARTLTSSLSGPGGRQSVATEPGLDLGDGGPRVLQRSAPAYNIEAEAGTRYVHGAEEPAVRS